MKKKEVKEIMTSIAKNMLLVGAMMAFALTGCGTRAEDVVQETQVQEIQVQESETEIETEQSSAVEQADAETPTMETAYLTDEMYERATSFMEGDLTRLAKAMRKAENGEKVTIGVIGGSITEGYTSTAYSGCYAAYFQSWWEKRFPEAEIDFVNAGVAGTSSYLGVHRVQEDLLDKNPDVVIVEFSVNDGNDFFYKKSYDNLVRRIMKWESEPAVMLLFTTQENGYNAQENDSLIGFRYRLPMLSYGNAIMPEIEAGSFKWADISPDTVHPNDRGHAIIGEMLYRYLNDVYARLDEISTEITPFTERAITVERYQEGYIATPLDITPISYGSYSVKDVSWQYKNNWHTDTGEEAIVFEVEAQNIGIVYHRVANQNYGMVDVYVDDVLVSTLDGEYSYGGNSESTEVYTSDAVAKHTVRIEKHPDSESGKFTIIGLLIS